MSEDHLASTSSSSFLRPSPSLSSLFGGYLKQGSPNVVVSPAPTSFVSSSSSASKQLRPSQPIRNPASAFSSSTALSQHEREAIALIPDLLDRVRHLEVEVAELKSRLQSPSVPEFEDDANSEARFSLGEEDDGYSSTSPRRAGKSASKTRKRKKGTTSTDSAKRARTGQPTNLGLSLEECYSMLLRVYEEANNPSKRLLEYLFASIIDRHQFVQTVTVPTSHLKVTIPTALRNPPRNRSHDGYGVMLQQIGLENCASDRSDCHYHVCVLPLLLLNSSASQLHTSFIVCEHICRSRNEARTRAEPHIATCGHEEREKGAATRCAAVADAAD